MEAGDNCRAGVGVRRDKYGVGLFRIHCFFCNIPFKRAFWVVFTKGNEVSAFALKRNKANAFTLYEFLKKIKLLLLK
ncbi:hypothetical protein GGTG_12833 [Gaeumannomyces tritici R3-111a-1]|uniref:Uncharacterized protein n=1 Tax=Gaeumannomyces tritici (strain R3-111a-1) TaxID=644352 RepID=J3PH53_GAET3|nr:hypothetical protein GGTG_12833 [Gaeumannomyces tritici R3-111a-1]EJT69950.1 hypothetical protein GGTG_12833 [Gaeumannomyces tritici R3-111a-1]